MPVPAKSQRSRSLMRRAALPDRSSGSVTQIAAASERRATICMELKPCAASVLTKSPIKPQQTAAAMM